MPKKIDNNHDEHIVLLDKIFAILEIDKVNNTFNLHELDNNLVKQKQILDLEDDIKKYYKCSQWSCFKTNYVSKRRWLSFIKYIVKSLDYKIFSYELKSNSRNNKHYEVLYKIYKE